MDENNNPISRNSYGIYTIWLSWVASAGAMILCLMLAMFTPRIHFPDICFALCLVFYVLVRNNRASRKPVCGIMFFTMSRSMFFSGLIMLVINLMHKKGFINLIFTDTELVNPRLPFIVSLIIFPMTGLFCALSLWRRLKMPFCLDCIRRNGDAPERGFLGSFFSREGTYQLTLMLVVCAITTVITWGYYFISYINVSLNGLDKFFYDIAPSIVFLASIIYVTVRYAGVYQYFSQNFASAGDGPGRTSRVRFMVISGDKMLLKVPEPTSDLDYADLLIDTPAEITLRRKEEVSPEMAERYFRNLTNISDAQIRELYHNTVRSNDFSAFYYLAVLPEPKLPDGASITGDWFTLHDIDEMMRNNALNPLLAAEIARLYKMTMAWKTYNPDGTRRYEIPDYKPRFQLSDLAEAPIDYNDSHWLFLAQHNEDRRFFRISRFWSRHVSGTAKQRK